jgi:hypothetical protein
VGLKTIVMTKNAVVKLGGVVSVQVRYFINSLSLDVREVVCVVWGYWLVSCLIGIWVLRFEGC